MYRVENVCLRESDIRESVVIFIHVLVKCLLESQMLYLYIHVMAAAHWPTRPDPTRLSKIGNSLKLQLFTTGGRTYKHLFCKKTGHYIVVS